MAIIALLGSASGCNVALPLERGSGPAWDGVQVPDLQGPVDALDASAALDQTRSDLSGPDLPRPDLWLSDTKASPDASLPDTKAWPDTAWPDVAPAPDTKAWPDVAPAPDTKAWPDVAPPPDTSPVNDVGGGAAKIVISEIMVNPKGTEPAEEWFEVYNSGAASADLAGWTIRDGPTTAHNHVIAASVVVGPGQRVVLAAAANPKVGSVYSYNPTNDTNGISLANDGDYLELLDAGGKSVHKVTIPPEWGLTEGYSWSYNSTGTSWCQETGKAYDGKNVGTPGAPPGC